MRNVIITIILFSTTVLICFVSVKYLNKISNNIYTENTSIMNNIKDGNWKRAMTTSTNMSKDWHIYSNRCSIFVNHTFIDDISLEEHKLEAYIKTKDKDEALASANSIEFLLERIKKLETINFENLF
ncbi:DUF4363 family protein [Clostridium akagii]|uniref:DUF4363 family protein n=1 Tax=Clostridium akagii TaxID=91623 RepID=UPI00047E55D4|nr:DUF4363 family protein [Clostridium akagii]